MKNIYILWAPGSVWSQTLDILRWNNDFNLLWVSLWSDDEKNYKILDDFDLEVVSARTEEQMNRYKERYKEKNITWVFWDEGLLHIASYPKEWLLVNALSGSAWLKPTVEAIKSWKNIALANKETLVMAWDIINSLVREYKVNLYSVDSEHSAIWQVLKDEKLESISKIVITASWGSFRDKTREELLEVTVEDALKHPNWAMWAKITIDSATMMNKWLEVIEAHYLFDIDYDKIDTVLHKQSIVHGLVYFQDWTVKASLWINDMKIPIAYALYYPNKANYKWDLELTELNFQKMDFERFPLLKLAYYVWREWWLLPTVMNAANEAAVKLFLDKKISFLEIERLITVTVNNFINKENPSLDDIIKTDKKIQDEILRNPRCFM